MYSLLKMGIFQPAMLVYWRVTKYESLSLKQQPNKNSVSTNLHLQEAAFFATNFATSMTNHETLLGTMPYPCPPLLKMMIDFPFSPFLMGYICSFPKEVRRVATSTNIFQKFRSSEPRFHIMTLQPLTRGFHLLQVSNVHRSGFRLDLHNQLHEGSCPSRCFPLGKLDPKNWILKLLDPWEIGSPF